MPIWNLDLIGDHRVMPDENLDGEEEYVGQDGISSLPLLSETNSCVMNDEFGPSFCSVFCTARRYSHLL